MLQATTTLQGKIRLYSDNRFFQNIIKQEKLNYLDRWTQSALEHPDGLSVPHINYTMLIIIKSKL